MIPVSALIIEALITIAAGVITDSPLTSAIIGGMFLIVSATINSVTLYLISRDERKRELARAKRRNRHSKATTHGEHHHSPGGSAGPDPKHGGDRAKD